MYLLKAYGKISQKRIYELIMEAALSILYEIIINSLVLF